MTIDRRAEEGWRLISSWDAGSGDYYLIWARKRSTDSAGDAIAKYRILPLPKFIDSLRQRSFGPWPPVIAEQMARLEPGWAFAAFCSKVGYVLQYNTDAAGVEAGQEVHSVLHRLPIWWRTLFGNSWIRLLSDELNRSSHPEAEIVSYLGSDNFLLRTSRAGQLAAPNDSRMPRSYQLAMWPHWKRFLLPGTPGIAPWFTEQAANGWELLSHYSGAIFLFSAST